MYYYYYYLVEIINRNNIYTRKSLHVKQLRLLLKYLLCSARFKDVFSVVKLLEL